MTFTNIKLQVRIFCQLCTCVSHQIASSAISHFPFSTEISVTGPNQHKLFAVVKTLESVSSCPVDLSRQSISQGFRGGTGSRKCQCKQPPLPLLPPAPPPEIHKPLQLANPQSRLRFPTMQLNSLIVSKNFSSNPQTSLCTVFT